MKRKGQTEAKYLDAVLGVLTVASRRRGTSSCHPRRVPFIFTPSEGETVNSLATCLHCPESIRRRSLLMSVWAHSHNSTSLTFLYGATRSDTCLMTSSAQTCSRCSRVVAIGPLSWQQKPLELPASASGTPTTHTSPTPGMLEMTFSKSLARLDSLYT